MSDIFNVLKSQNSHKIITLIKDETNITKLVDVSTGETVLHTAVRLKLDYEVVNLLLEKGADINAQDKKGQTALFIAAKTHSVKIVELLLSKNAKISVADVHHRTSLFKAVSSFKSESFHSIQTVNLLLEKTISSEHVNIRNSWFKAVKNGNEKLIALFVLRGININVERVSDKESIINCWLTAAAKDNRELLTAFLEKGIDINTYNIIHKNTALHMAASHHQIELVRYLLSQKANPNIVNMSGKSPLLCTTDITLFKISGDSSKTMLDSINIISELLLEKGANINAQDSKGNTYFHYFLSLVLQLAITSPKEETQSINFLLEYNPNLGIKNNEGKNALGQQTSTALNIAYGRPIKLSHGV